MKAITLSMTMVFLLFALANANWSDDPNTNNPVCTAAGDQKLPQLIGDGSGGAIITWYDDRSGNSDIYARRVDANGDTLWPADGLAICTAAGDQWYQELVGDGSGGAIITWYDYRSGSESDIYAQRVDANGDTLWPADGLAICTAAYNQSAPQLISDGTGGAIIAWQDNRNGSANHDIYAHQVDASGDTLWPADGVAICTAAYNQWEPQLCGDGSGGAIITWEDNRSGSGGSSGDIYAQRIGADGDTLWPADGLAVCTAAYNQHHPKLIDDGTGGAIIAWDDMRSGSEYDIYSQRVDANGDTLWQADGVVICTAAGLQSYPELIDDGSRGAIITWLDGRSGVGNYDIYAQRVNFNGTLGGAQPPANVDDLTVSLAVEDLVLMWSPVTGDTSGAPLVVDLYRIYRDTVAGFELSSSPLDSTLDTSYVDTSGVVGDIGTHCYYAVTAVAAGQESEPSEQVGAFDRDLSNSP